MNNFKPTRLYIKRHVITGLRYFGKTTGTEKYLLEQYNGSGDYWNKHLLIHGKEHVVTDWHCLFTDKDDLVDFAEFFSEEMDIVNAKDKTGQKIWANLKCENGLDGSFPDIPWNKGKKGYKQSAEACIKKSKALLGIKRGPQSSEHKEKHSLAMKGKNLGPQTAEHIANKTKAKTGVKHKSHKKHGLQEKVCCPHCNVIGGISVMKRHHFDRCKIKGCNND